MKMIKRIICYFKGHKWAWHYCGINLFVHGHCVRCDKKGLLKENEEKIFIATFKHSELFHSVIELK